MGNHSFYANLDVKGSIIINSSDRAITLIAPTVGGAGLSYNLTLPANFGSPLQALRINSSGTALEFYTPSSGGGASGNIAEGGNSFGRNISIGTIDNYDFCIRTNNNQYFEFSKNGNLNIWANSRYAVQNNHVTNGGVLVIGDRTKNYGGGNSGWNSNTAQFLLEFNEQTEVAGENAGVGLNSFFFYQGGSSKTLTFGRDMGYGRTKLIRLASESTHIEKDITIGDSSNGLPYNDGFNRVLNIHSSGQSFGLTFSTNSTDSQQIRSFLGLRGDFYNGGQRGFFLGTKTNHPINFVVNDITRFVITETGIKARQNGSASSPYYSWWDDQSSGLYREGASTIALATNGMERMRIRNNSQILLNTNNNLNNPGQPHYSFNGNWGESDGMYFIGSGILGFSCGGIERFRIDSQNQVVKTNNLSFQASSYRIEGISGEIISSNRANVPLLASNATTSDCVAKINQLINALADNQKLITKN